mmetsp:Transcript_53011/g.142941  ORF Transcript_53011/g.142941 Transcript_53011/m.142941 type:complete len:249 (-) Transcript_53011:50-796(-)
MQDDLIRTRRVNVEPLPRRHMLDGPVVHPAKPLLEPERSSSALHLRVDATWAQPALPPRGAAGRQEGAEARQPLVREADDRGAAAACGDDPRARLREDVSEVLRDARHVEHAELQRGAAVDGGAREAHVAAVTLEQGRGAPGHDDLLVAGLSLCNRQVPARPPLLQEYPRAVSGGDCGHILGRSRVQLQIVQAAETPDNAFVLRLNGGGRKHSGEEIQVAMPEVVTDVGAGQAHLLLQVAAGSVDLGC